MIKLIPSRDNKVIEFDISQTPVTIELYYATVWPYDRGGNVEYFTKSTDRGADFSFVDFKPELTELYGI